MSEANTNRRQVTIAGETFEVAVPYEAGHTLNEAEASVLNQTFVENIRNNVAGKIKALREAAEKDGATFSLDATIAEGENAGKTHRQVLTEYADSYEFGVRSARVSEPVDPVQREARSIARDLLNAKLRDAGTKRKDVDDEAYEAALNTLAKRDEIQKEAKRRVDQRSKIGGDELDLGSLLGASEEAAA